MRAATISGVAIASTMKLIHKVVELQFATQRPDMFIGTNSSCLRTSGTSHATPSDHSAAFTWIWSARYLLPVLGGALSVAGFGYVRALKLGGFVMLLSTVLMSVAVHVGWMCSRPQLCLAVWFLLPLTFALVHPNAMHAIFRWHRTGSRACTIVSAVYCGSAVLGECIGMLLPVLDKAGAGDNITIAGAVISGLFLWLTLTLQEELEYTFPPMSRVIRYCHVFAALIAFVIAVSDCRPVVYLAEIQYMLESLGDEGLESSNWVKVWSPEVVKLISITATCALIAFTAWCVPVRRLPRRKRIQAGIVVECGISLSLMIINLQQLSSFAAVRAIYTTASCLDGVATGVTMVAAYELMDAMSDRSSKPLVIGIMFTVLGLANILGRLLLMLFRAIPPENPILQPRAGRKPLFFVYHLTMLLLLLLSLFYHRCFAFRLASTAVTDDDDGFQCPEEPRVRDKAEQPLLEEAQDSCN